MCDFSFDKDCRPYGLFPFYCGFSLAFLLEYKVYIPIKIWEMAFLNIVFSTSRLFTIFLSTGDKHSGNISFLSFQNFVL